MGQTVVNVGSFDLTSHNGNTAYSSVRYFDIPANAGITGCVATFATHVNTGNFQGKSFSLNGAQAHPNTPWPTSGIALNPALLATGQNSFRAAVKSQAGLSARWAIGDIYLTITYTEGGGGGSGGGSTGNPTVSPMTATVGTAVNVSIPATPGRWFDAKWKFEDLEGNLINGGNWGTASSGSVTITAAMMAQIPSSMSGTMVITVREFDTPAMPYNIVATKTYDITINVPASAIPTIGTFTATRNANGVDASITNYVQNYSKVNLLIDNVSGALGSSIVSYEITGGGNSAATSSATFGPFSQTGDIAFTAKVTDTRGRTATKSVSINVLPYTPVSGVNLLAYRSDGSMVADDEGAYATLRGRRVFSSLDGQNAATIKGRVYEKDTTAPGWTNLTDDTLTLFGSGTLSQEKGYTAEISINDKITSVVYVFQIPTAIVGIHIMPGATGMGLGEYAESGKLKVSWPIYSQGEKVALASYPVGAVFLSIVNTSPATLFGGTWSALPAGRFLRAGTGGTTGGSDTHAHTTAAVALTVAQLAWHQHGMSAFGWDLTAGSKLRAQANGSSQTISEKTDGAGGGEAHGHGNTGSSSNVPAYYEVYAWRRTA